MSHRRNLVTALLSPALAVLAACQSTGHPAMSTVEKVDLPRFMGDWYVIASIPTLLERGAYNAVESYSLDADGSIATTFTFNDGSFEGKRKQYRPRGFIRDRQSNALWGMQFVWPIKADYRITYLNADYTQTVISRHKRDYVWIMGRTPRIPDADYERLVQLVEQQGYDISKLQRVPQRWPE